MSRLASFRTLAARRAATAWTRGAGYADRSVAAGAALVAACTGWAEAGPLSARSVVESFVLLELVLATAVVPLSHVLALAGERERVSFDLLLLAPMSGAEQLLARAVGRLLGIAAVLAAATPPLLLVVPAGGVSAAEIVAAQMHVLAVAVVSVALASFLSAVFVKPAIAVGVGWGLMAAWLGGAWLGRRFGPPQSPWWDAMESASLSTGLAREWAAVGADFGAAAAALAWASGVLLAMCLAGGAQLRSSQAAAAGKGARSGSAAERAFRRAVASPRWARWFRPLVPGRHPLVRQAVLADRDAGFRLAWLVLAGLLAVAAGAMAFGGAGRSLESHRALSGGCFLLVLLLTASRGAVGLGLDRRRGRLETLISANVEPDDMLRARLAGLLQRGAYLALPAATYGVLVELAFDPSPAGALRTALLLVGAGLALATAAVVSLEEATRFRWTIQGFVDAVVVAVPLAVGAGALAASGPIRAAFFVPLWIVCLMAVHAKAVRRLRSWILD